MYAALWRALPGPVWLRVLIVLVLLAGILWALAYVVFPWAADVLLPQDVTVEE
ncbi:MULTISPECIES: hypothetical protein [unclassified Microcella]|uniref:hypothetical protein n=1 Tax=unclassified Microcella TaxID=2630066 RepID=UPI00191068C1|nr:MULTISPECIES: hypothetical protein [unclassified Microcella]